MSKRKCKAVLDLSPNDYDGINEQAKLFLDGLYVETTLYATPPITQVDFKAQYDASFEATSAAREVGTVEKSDRNKECAKTLEMMADQLIPYINGLYAGNRTNIEKSGAKSSTDPSPVPAPDSPIISRVDDGPETKAVKIYLVRGVNSTLKKRSRILYRIFMFEKETDTLGIEVGSSYNSNKLIGYNIPENVLRYYGVIAQNSGGSSPLSTKEKYYLLA